MDSLFSDFQVSHKQLKNKNTIWMICLHVCVCVHYMHAWFPLRLEKGFRSLRIGIRDACEIQYAWCQPNWGPLLEQQVFLVLILAPKHLFWNFNSLNSDEVQADWMKFLYLPDTFPIILCYQLVGELQMLAHSLDFVDWFLAVSLICISGLCVSCDWLLMVASSYSYSFLFCAKSIWNSL